MTSSFARADLLVRPGLEPLWDELARRYGQGAEPVTLSLRDLSLPQRRALADLLGSDRLPGPEFRISVRRLADALAVNGSNDLREVVEQLRGPILNRRALRAAGRLERERLWAWLAEEAAALTLFEREPDCSGDPPADRWVDAVRAGGVPRGDLQALRRHLAGVLTVLGALPTESIGLAALADDALGDPHGLDRNRTASALVLEAVAIARGRDRPSDAEGIRALWEEVGVVPDPLSSTVLTLGVNSVADDPLGDWLGAAAAASEPVALTLAQLRRWPVAALPGGAVGYVVENPSLLVEAASGRWSGPPIVCSSGRPTLAVVTLLRQLGAGGAILAQHADFDPAGLGITAWLTERAGTRPWRMGERDYRVAVAVSRSRLPVLGAIPSTPWDPPLHVAVADTRLAVFEEELRHELLGAMGRSSLTG